MRYIIAVLFNPNCSDFLRAVLIISDRTILTRRPSHVTRHSVIRYSITASQAKRHSVTAPQRQGVTASHVTASQRHTGGKPWQAMASDRRKVSLVASLLILATASRESLQVHHLFSPPSHDLIDTFYRLAMILIKN